MCVQVSPSEALLSSALGFETRCETIYDTTKPDSLLEFNSTLVDLMSWSSCFESDRKSQLESAWIEFSNDNEYPLSASAMTVDSLQPRSSSQRMSKGSGEDSIPLELGPRSKQSQQSSLTIVYENGRGEMSTGCDIAKPAPGRHGPLPTESALRIAKTRREKTVCISCRICKVAVSFQ
jgi:hypothetical protein